MTRRMVLHVIRKESRKILISHRVVDQLSPHHDSQFSAFSSEVFKQMNRKHNHSSSHFTNLADKTERRVASTGAGQPKYWPKTWFGAYPYNAKLMTQKYAIELFGLFRQPICCRIKPLAICAEVSAWNNRRSKVRLYAEKQILKMDYVH